MTYMSQQQSQGPFENPANKVVTWKNQQGVYNQKIVEGPDEGVHRGIDPNTGRAFQTGTERKPKD
jgi:hypothetical protein